MAGCGAWDTIRGSRSEGKREERGSRGKKEGIILDLGYGLGLGAAGADVGKGTCVRGG